jgi:hypothetical protein
MKKNIVTIRQYAQLCGVSITIIRRRIGARNIKTTMVNGATTIDTDKYPPRGKTSVGRPRHEKLLAEANI